MIRILQGDVREQLRSLPAESVHTCVTSPPYFGLRSYLPDDHPDKAKEIGLEPTPEAYVAELVAVFREVRRVLRKDGTCWINLGDSYAGGGRGGGANGSKQQTNVGSLLGPKDNYGLKPKDLIGIPWMVAFALRAEGWWLRQEIIWAKPNPMPESVRDRCCKSHEYMFLLTKSERYFYDSDAIAEDVQDLQYVSSDTADRLVLQEQSTKRRTSRQVPRLHGDLAQGMGSEIQQISEGQSNGQTLLPFGEGAKDKTVLSAILRDDRGAARQISTSDASPRKNAALQNTQEAIRSDREGASCESEERQELFSYGQGSVQQAQDRDQTEASDQIGELHFNEGTMDGDQDQVSPSLRLLQSEACPTGNGSHRPAIEGRPSYSGEHRSGVSDMQCQERQPAVKRTKRSVWTVATAPFKSAHFATFPPALIEPCILAGCPAKACAKCGAPWVREVERLSDGSNDASPAPGSVKAMALDADIYGPGRLTSERRGPGTSFSNNPSKRLPSTRSRGLSSSCSCDAGTVAGTCLDPFGGAGTTGLVADRLQRNAILIELNAEYAAMAERRCFDDAPLLMEAAE